MHRVDFSLFYDKIHFVSVDFIYAKNKKGG